MARPLRIQFAGALYHVISRGNERRAIVLDDADRFGHDPADWQQGRRVDDASRALAAYLARRRFGYSSRQVAPALGYRGHGGVSSAVARIESADPAIQRTAEELARRITND